MNATRNLAMDLYIYGKNMARQCKNDLYVAGRSWQSRSFWKMNKIYWNHRMCMRKWVWGPIKSLARKINFRV
jgi:hypothetical protein